MATLQPGAVAVVSSVDGARHVQANRRDWIDRQRTGTGCTSRAPRGATVSQVGGSCVGNACLSSATTKMWGRITRIPDRYRSSRGVMSLHDGFPEFEDDLAPHPLARRSRRCGSRWVKRPAVARDRACSRSAGSWT